MPSNKDRLYVALYARGGRPVMPGLEDTYHWALIIGPKKEEKTSRGTRFHAKETLQRLGNSQTPQSVWEYDERDSSLLPSSMLLVRVMIGKVKDRKRLELIFRNVPIRRSIQGWNCVSWVKEAIETALQDERALSAFPGSSWASIRDRAMWYVETKKAAHRFDGTGNFDNTLVATWDMFEGKERIP